MNGKRAIVNKNQGVLIVCEGISGSGKSETIVKLSNQLRASGYQVNVLEWNSNPIIRSIAAKIDVWGWLTPNVYSLLQWIGFLIDYFRVMVPLLKKKQVVIADRYVYTGATRDAVNGASKLIGKIIVRFTRKPDWLLFCDTPPQICYERIAIRGKTLFHPNKAISQNDQIPNKDLYYLKQMREAYVGLLEDVKAGRNTHVFVLNGNSKIVELFIEDYIAQKLGVLKGSPVIYPSLGGKL
ncbi:deoxynucleoside kinase [Paenibacillus sp. SYP-B3998]|uniref:Deoxynucleoside kinase n=1 Tax=Paenibacillus sp. SYP-B3998 TaxID=2678564 RepID=A0A6G3ZVX6_9BACL|nr:deoxynucleoside kinase [Paenibacillus sp. SYP-B3998]NEW06265.1 deoxynucleoside kinase [Paenibacillus sp. SYP-B3998]